MKQVTDLQKMKNLKEKIVMVTAYDYPSARHAEETGVDVILVGDSLGMVVLGYDSTIPVTLGDMIHHSKAVRRGAPQTFVVVDLPFMSYHLSIRDTLLAATKIVQETGAQAVKLEGADEVVEHVKALSRAGVAVVGHLGLTPQSVAVLGGYKVQGKDAMAAKKLIKDAKELEAAGACMVVLECVPRQLGEVIAKELMIPVIGIGAGAEVDGQVLVYHDVLTYGVKRVPKFVQAFADIDPLVSAGLSSYVAAVKNSEFPAEAHTFTMKDEELERVYGGGK